MIKRLFIFFSMVVFISGCATTRMITTPSAPPPDLGISAKDDNFSVSLNYVIVPNGPGSWVKGACWDEYVLTLRSITNKTITLEQIRMIDPRGVYVHSGASAAQLESMEEGVAKIYKNMDMSTAAILGTDAIVSTVAQTASIATNMAMIPLADTATTLFAMAPSQQVTNDLMDRTKIDSEIFRRQFTTVTLAGNATISGSAFFPTIPNPKDLVIDYRIGNDNKALEMPLEKLAGLHVAPVKEKKK